MNKEFKLQAILDNAIDGVLLINHTGIIEYVNPMAADIFGDEIFNFTGQELNKFIVIPENEILNYTSVDVLQKLSGVRSELIGRKKNGDSFTYSITVSEANLDGEKVYAAFIMDQTQQKKTELSQNQYTIELERSNLELQDFAYITSHDLQEPLRKIQAFGERLMQKDLAQLSEQGKEYLSRMLSAAVRMQNLINDLLSFSRLNTQPGEFKLVDLNNTLSEVLTDLEVSIEKSQASINYTRLPCIEADSTQVRQVFQNLISNAIKFKKDNEPLKINIYHRVSEDDTIVEIIFEDNGIGFDEKYRNKIFNVFQRLESQKYPGTGMGLAICKKIVAYHRGEITAQSKVGVGSSFSVKLPLRQEIGAVYNIKL